MGTVATTALQDGTGRARLSRDAILDAARVLLDEHGTAAFSMRVLAESLGSSPMSLYRHVADRADLEISVARRVAAELTFDDDEPSDPEAAIGEWMRRVRAHWLRHPWFGHFIGQHPELADVMVGLGQHLFRLLRAAGADERLAAEELIRISRITHGVVVVEQAAPLSSRSGRALPSRVGTLSGTLFDLLGPSFDDDRLFDDVVSSTVLGVRARLANPNREGEDHVHH
jgi:AcrR family transcriptional regulator